jgi:hypothetical protein
MPKLTKDPNPALTKSIVSLCKSEARRPGPQGSYARRLLTAIERESKRLAKELSPKAA